MLETEDQIRRRITHGCRRWFWLFLHFMVTLPFGMIVVTVLNHSRVADVLLAVWFAALGIHFMFVIVEAIKELVIQHEIERQQNLAAHTGGGKQKRSNRLALGDDGELLDTLGIAPDEKDMSAY